MFNVLCVAEDIDRAKFYCRFKTVKKIFITSNAIVYIYLKLYGEKCWLIKKQLKNIEFFNEENIKNTIEIKTKSMEINEGIELANATEVLLQFLHRKYGFQYCFIWNGCKIVDVVCSKFASENAVKKCFFEISNITGKLFVDYKGTNRCASIFDNPKVLDYTDEGLIKRYESWLKGYLNEKKGAFILPQSRKKSKILRILSPLVNLLAQKFQISFENNIYKENLKNIIGNVDKCLPYINKNTSNNYIFVPLQVSNDTQIIINSNIDLQKLIDTAIQYAMKDGLDVVIKPHPAEKNLDIIDYICNQEKYCNVLITNENTFNLIENSKYVITINSTVGLEAIIANKKVIVLGDAIYSRFNTTRLQNYIMDFLIDVDYFSKENLTENMVNKILQRGR